jgi:hypothetical protein
VAACGIDADGHETEYSVIGGSAISGRFEIDWSRYEWLLLVARSRGRGCGDARNRS